MECVNQRSSTDGASNVIHLHGSGSHRYVGLKRSLSQDPLLAPNTVGGPFEVILPSRKYEGDYEGERVEWLPDGRTVDPVEEARRNPDVEQKDQRDGKENSDLHEG